MRTVLQRVRYARVSVDGEVVGEIDSGYLALVGVNRDDTDEDVAFTVKKIAQLRLFPNEYGKFDRSVTDTGGAVLVVSQFTLLGDPRKGNRPSFHRAADPQKGEKLVEAVVRGLEERSIEVQTGRFGAMMDVELLNDGPVTLIIDSPSERNV